MRAFLATFLLGLALFGGAFAFTQLVANNRYLGLSSTTLQLWAHSLPEPPAAGESELIREAVRRARIYDDQIQSHHLLVDGMLVNRTLAGNMLDECDSLLFSSLRYVSLHKLGFNDRAQAAWDGIQNSQENGRWLRHPRCTKSTSRDMILGLLAALSQKPPGFTGYLHRLMQHVQKHNGYFGKGPIYVSYLSPGLAQIIALLAVEGKIPAQDVPKIIRDGYSTHEIELYVVRLGFEAHLNALTIWLEMELTHNRDETPNTLARSMDGLIAPFGPGHIEDQRTDWITSRLLELEPHNLFIRYLRLEAANALTPAVSARLLAELLAMPEFPHDRLPMDCDRPADYLWQRTWHPYKLLVPKSCTQEYNGADYLWMASLLVERLRQPPTVRFSH